MASNNQLILRQFIISSIFLKKLNNLRRQVNFRGEKANPRAFMIDSSELDYLVNEFFEYGDLKAIKRIQFSLFICKRNEINVNILI